MHTVRIIAAMIAGGYASILSAYLIAAHSPLPDAGRDGVIFGPLAVAAFALAVSALTYRRPAPLAADTGAARPSRIRKVEA